MSNTCGKRFESCLLMETYIILNLANPVERTIPLIEKEVLKHFSVKSLAQAKNKAKAEGRHIITLERRESPMECKCGESEDIDWESFEMQDGNSGYFKATCGKCGAKWREWHSLDWIENIEA